jgi:ectoine hydroxylase-related dioxygenase (phytanoyl-CoA dioxygenase family)
MEEKESGLSLELIAKARQAALDLEEKGWAVVASVYTAEECDEVTRQMWECLSQASGGELRPEADFAIMPVKDLPSHKHGIIEAHRLNHAAPIRKVRRDPRFIALFSLLHGTDQLTASMDRVNFKFPGRVYRSAAPWPHMDQCPRRLERISVQSYLTMMDAGEDDPSNQLYQGSHRIFAEHWKEKRTQETSDWYKLTPEEATELGKLCPLVKPVLHKGDLLLWDSRTVHSPSDGTTREGRFVIYLCYGPLWEKASDTKFLEKKKQAFLECRATSHSPVPQKLFGKYPRSYDGQKVRYAEFPAEALGIGAEPVEGERLLFGFEGYKGREGLHNGVGWKAQWGVEEALLQFHSPFLPLQAPYKAKRVKSDKKSVKKLKRH